MKQTNKRTMKKLGQSSFQGKSSDIFSGKRENNSWKNPYSTSLLICTGTISVLLIWSWSLLCIQGQQFDWLQVLTLGLKCLHHTANLKAGTKSPRHTIAFILIKTDFARRFLLLLQSACSMAKRDNDIKESFTEKRDFQLLKEFKFLSLLSRAFI